MQFLSGMSVWARPLNTPSFYGICVWGAPSGWGPVGMAEAEAQDTPRGGLRRFTLVSTFFLLVKAGSLRLPNKGLQTR